MTLVKRNENGRGRLGLSSMGMYKDLSELFDNYFNDSAGRSSLPAVNISESDDKFEMEVSAPGYKKEDINVTVEDEQLIISAEKKEEQEERKKNYSRQEFRYGSFQRSFTLPESVDSENINCQYKDGLLMIDIPKREEAKPKPARKLEIN